MGASSRRVNVVGVGSTSLEEMKFEALYNEEVKFLSNQGGAYRSNYLRQGGIKIGVEMKDGKIETVREWRDRNPNWKDGEKDRYVPPMSARSMRI